MSALEKPEVLLVEDNPTGIASIVGILGAACDLVIAKNLKQAHRCVSPEIDLILLDLYLPDGTGVEFLSYLKTSTSFKDLPVICISASDDNEDIEKAFTAGAIDYVLKPFNRTILSAKVSTFIDLKRKTDILASQALSDPLTGIGNRRFFEQQLDIEWRRAARQGVPVGLALIDLDHFKLINDRHGHAMGDVCLRNLAKAMEGTFSRAGDVVARLGGDEFVAILPGASTESATAAARRLQSNLIKELGGDRASGSGCPEFTTSIGCYSLQPGGDAQISELIDTADKHLYQAKEEGGRACVRPLIQPDTTL